MGYARPMSDPELTTSPSERLNKRGKLKNDYYERELASFKPGSSARA